MAAEQEIDRDIIIQLVIKNQSKIKDSNTKSIQYNFHSILHNCFKYQIYIQGFMF